MVTALDNLMKQRMKETFEKECQTMKECRLKIDDVYRAIIIRIEAFAEVEGKENYEGFIKRLNIIIQSYKDTIAKRLFVFFIS